MIVCLLVFLPISILAQQVKGTITDGTNGFPLGGASILIKGTSRGTTSDFDGNYNLNVNSFPATLVFSSLGFETIEKIVNEAGTVNVTMKESLSALDEVVITGLATSVKRSNAANAVASVSAAKLAEVTPPQTLDGALSGKVVGTLINSNSGAPGGGFSVRLRGLTSIFGNNQPLYIVDGIYISNISVASSGVNTVSAAAGGGNPSSQDNASNRIADLNPNDIANIEILKGASAAAIYGSRGAAGVIIITTKKGKQGKTKINFSQSLGFNEIINPLGVRNFTEDNVAPADLTAFIAARDAGRLIDYEDEIFGNNGFITNSSVSASGGGEKTSFYAGFSREQEDGIVRNTGIDRSNVRLNLDHRFNDNIKVSLSSNYVNSSADRGFFNNDNSQATIGVSLTRTRPFDDLFPDENGNFPDHPNSNSNPLQTIELFTNNERVNRFIIGGNIEATLFRTDKQSLKFTGRTGTDFFSQLATVIFPQELQFQSVQGGLNGVTAVTTTNNRNANYAGFLVHNYTTGSNLSFTTQVGLTNEQFSQNTVGVIATDLIGGQTNVDQGANISSNQFRLLQEDFGFFVQEEFNYQDKILATIGVRGDKSTNNGDPNEFFYYPKASAAANLHNFDFWKENNIVNRLKPRVAYGEAGTFATFGSLFTLFNSTLINGNVGVVVPATQGNLGIQPERNKEFEIGFDAGFLNDRLSLTFTYYNKETEDFLVVAQVPGSSGFTGQQENGGDFENRGLEISLNANVFNNDHFSWDTNVNWFRNQSEVTRLNVPTFNLGGFGNSLGQFQIEEGESVTQIVGTTGPGTPVVQLGDTEPDFQVTWQNDLKYKDFTLSFLWHWKQGGDNINLTRLLSDFGGTSSDFDDFDFDPNINNGTFRIQNGLFSNNAAPFVEDASYLRLREIGLKYSIPSELLSSWFGDVVSNINVGVSGRNIINIFDYNSYDPEVSNFGGNGLSTGVEVTPFPSAKRFLFSLSAQF